MKSLSIGIEAQARNHLSITNTKRVENNVDRPNTIPTTRDGVVP